MVHLFFDWDKLREDLRKHFIYLFLDYDGTLTPIVESPRKAIIPDDVKKLLFRLSQNPRCKIAIISGRALNDIKKLVSVKGIIYVGNHGLEIEGPKIRFKSVIPSGFKEILKRIKFDLNKRLSSIKGIFFEDKGCTLSLHYRLVNEKQISLVQAAFHEAIVTYLVNNKIKINQGKMVLEIRPPVEWNKGKAVLWLLARQRFALKGKEVFPVYIGDDITDEDAFKALKNKGATVFVGSLKEFEAKYYLKDPKEVKEFLKRILELEKI